MTDYERMKKELCSLGMKELPAGTIVRKIREDELAFADDEDRIKTALQKGFLPRHAELYGLNEHNYNDYLSDYSYYMMHPINHHFRIWINDKLTLKYVLNEPAVADTMPEYYIYIENDGTYTYLMDFPGSIEKNENVLFELLKAKKVLAMKPNSGTSYGNGFIKLELSEDGKLFENNRLINNDRLAELQESMRNYIITEYIRQHPSFAKIWPDNECALRIIMCKNTGNDPYAPSEWNCVLTYARFGTTVSGGVSNFVAGGIAVNFDYDTGVLDRKGILYLRGNTDKLSEITVHPETGEEWAELKIPNWEFTKAKLDKICSYISSLSYLGFDVIITESGMKLCEINTMPALGYEQYICGPVLEKEKVREFFTAKGLRKHNNYDLYQAYLNSQVQGAAE